MTDTCDFSTATSSRCGKPAIGEASWSSSRDGIREDADVPACEEHIGNDDLEWRATVIVSGVADEQIRAYLERFASKIESLEVAEVDDFGLKAAFREHGGMAV